MAQFDPVVIPVSADVQQLERAFQKVAKDAEKTAKSVQKSFDTAFKSIGGGGAAVGSRAAQVGGQAARNSGNLFQNVGGKIGGAANFAFAVLDIKDAFASLGAAGKHLSNPAGQLKNFAQVAVQSSGQIVSGLGQIGLAFQGINSVVGVATQALSGFFKSTVGREIEFRRTVLNIQTTIASTSRVFDKTGAEITKPLEKIRSLEKPIRESIRNIIRESEKISGTTSEEIIQMFQIITTYSGQAKLSLKEAEQLSLRFAAGLGTLGLPAYQASQEIGSILSGQITEDSQLAKKLGITPQDVERAKQSAGGLFKYLNDKLATVAAGQEEASRGFDGLVSNIQEIQQNVQQAFGAPLLDPLLNGLNAIYDILSGTKEQFKAAAAEAGKLVGNFSSNIIGGGFRGLQTVATNVRKSLSSSGTAEVGSELLRSLQEAGASVGRSLESALNKAGEKVDSLIAAFGQLVTVMAKLRIDQLASYFQTWASSVELYLNSVFKLQALLISLKARILDALGPIGQFMQAFKAVDQVLGPVIKALSNILLVVLPNFKNMVAATKALMDVAKAIGTVTKVAKEAESIKQFAQLTSTLAQATKQAESFSVATAATFQAASILGQAGALLGKVFSPLLPLFGALGKAAVGLAMNLFMVQAATLAIQAAVTIGIMAWQQYGDMIKRLNDLAKERAASERIMADAVDKGTDAVSRRRREDDMALGRQRLDTIVQARKELQDLQKNKEAFEKNKNSLLPRNDLSQFGVLAKNLSGDGPAWSRGDDNDKALSDAIRQVDKDLDQRLKSAKNAKERGKIVDQFLKGLVFEPGALDKLDKQLADFYNKQDQKLNELEKRNEARRIDTAAKTAFENLAQYVTNTASVSLNKWNEAVGALQNKLATLAPDSAEYTKTESALALAKAQLEQAGKSVADRFLEAKQHANAIAKTILDGEEQARSIRRETQREVRESVLAGIDEETAALVEQLDSKKQREEDIQTRIKRNQIEIAEIAAKMSSNLVKKTLVIQGIWEAISAQMQNTANQMVAAANQAVQNMQSQDPGLADRSGFRGAMGNSGRSAGNHFHLQNQNTNQLLKDAIKEVLYLFQQGAQSVYLGRSKATITPGTREARIRELLESERVAHGGNAIDIQGNSGGGLGKRPDGRPFLTANILRNWSYRDGLGYSGDAAGGTMYGHFDGKVSVGGPAHSSMESRRAHASWYGGNFIGRKTASGVKYTRDMMGVAHKTLPFGTVIEFEHGGRKVVAQVVDRGPFIAGRDFDLMEAPATQLGIKSKGVADINYRIIERGRGQTRMPENLRRMAAANGMLPSGAAGSIPINDLATIQRNADAAYATLGLDREIEQLNAQKAAIEKSNDALREQLAIVSRIDLLQRRKEKEDFTIKSRGLRLDKEGDFQKRRNALSDVADNSLRLQKEMELNAEEALYQSFGYKIEEIEKITIPYIQKKLQDSAVKRNPKAAQTLNDALDAARKLLSMFQQSIPERLKLSVEEMQLQVNKAQAQYLNDAKVNNRRLERLLKVNRGGTDIEQQLSEFFAQDGVVKTDALEKLKREEFTNAALEELTRSLGSQLRNIQDESTFRGLSKGGMPERDVAILRMAAEQAKGLTNFQGLPEKDRKKYLSDAAKVFDAQQAFDVEDQLKAAEKQLRVDRLRLKELAAITNEQKAQLALEREIASLAPGKSMTEEEQGRFKTLQLEQLNLQDMLAHLGQLREGFSGFFTDLLAGFDQAAQAGTSFWDAITGAMANFFMKLGNYLIDLAAQQAGQGIMGWIQEIFGIGSSIVGGFGSPVGPVAGLPQAWNTGQFYGPAFANGGIAQGGFLPVRAFANGGMVTQPTIGIVGEGRFNEAIVPLPDGKSIPVQLSGAGVGGVQIGSVNITVQNTGEALSVEAQRSIANQARAIAVEEIIKQQRSGGLLRQGGYR